MAAARERTEANPFNTVRAIIDTPFLDKTAESVVRDESEIGESDPCEWTRGIALTDP
ncbi:unnamed protein product [Arabidopsis lyrata]|nr:unnamed protein product [Arabidopsis lyrata]